MTKKVLLSASNSIIEPLALLHLSSIAVEEEWKPKIKLIGERGFEELIEEVECFNPDLLGFTVYTGNHIKIFDWIDKIKKERPNLLTVIGGPHPTYFPKESLNHADYVVISEGFSSFRKILKGNTQKGILHLSEQESFPSSNREEFYKNHPTHANSPIKSVIARTGCPFKCTYCYNSSTLESVRDSLSDMQISQMEKVVGRGGRLFPKSSRSVEEILNEVKEIKRCSPETKMIYFQDDIFGEDINWIREFAKKYPEIGLPFHAQMRFEFANPQNPKGKERMELIKKSGGTGITFAIESAIPSIRKDVLNRNMREDLMFDVLTFANYLGFNVRTEQMLGLPYGATKEKTEIGIEADLKTLELNVRLKQETSLPTIAWASIFAPYRGTPIGNYCRKHGFYERENNDVPETFFERSVLRFPKEWIGPKLQAKNKSFWLEEKEQTKHRDKLQMLRDLFTNFALIPEGHQLAKTFLENPDQSYGGLSKLTRHHLYDKVLYKID